MIHVEHLSKSYGPTRALDGVSFDVARGEVVGLLGPNGAGKTTVMRILAGYMLVVGKEMCQKYDMVNLHPATPGGPAGTWQEVIWQLIDSKAEETGVMMHLITPELDKGPPVAYCTFPIRGNPFDEHWEEIQGHSLAEIRKKQGESNPLFQLIRQHGLHRELPLIVATIKAFANGRVKITAEKKVVDADGRPIIGYNLTSEIDTQLRRAH